jgi:hypothetical protein
MLKTMPSLSSCPRLHWRCAPRVHVERVQVQGVSEKTIEGSLLEPLQPHRTSEAGALRVRNKSLGGCGREITGKRETKMFA